MNGTRCMGSQNQQGVQGASYAANKTHQEIYTSEDAPRIHASMFYICSEPWSRVKIISSNLAIYNQSCLFERFQFL